MLAIAGDAIVGVPAIGPRGGTCCITQPSKVGKSGAMPGEAGNDATSLGGNRSMTVRRVSILVPCLA
jgi:hypothetical protein